MLEESTSSSATQKEIRAQRESELASIRKSLEDEISSNEATVSSMRQKHSRAIEDLNEQMDALKKVHMYMYIHITVLVLMYMYVHVTTSGHVLVFVYMYNCTCYINTVLHMYM